MTTQPIPLNVGDSAPEFSLRNAQGETISLSDYRGEKVVVYFYPKAATPGCTIEACDFRDNLNSLKGAGYVVLGISPDEPAALAQFVVNESLTFDLLSDTDYAVSTAYGSYGERTKNGNTFTGTLRSTVVVDPQGKISHVEYGVEARGHVARLRETLGV